MFRFGGEFLGWRFVGVDFFIFVGCLSSMSFIDIEG